MAAQELRRVVERLFSAEYLFDPHHKSWRDLVAPASVKATEQNPAFDVAAMLGIVEVFTLCNPATAAQEIMAAIAGSSVVEIVDAAAHTLRRRQHLDDTLNPEHRTVFARPVPPAATDAAIREFFSKIAPVDRVERKAFVEDGVEKTKPFAYIVFKTREGAAACIAAKPSYAHTGDGLSDAFIPKLVLAMKVDHERATAEVAAGEFTRNQRAVMNQATPNATDEVKRRSLRKGCTMIVRNLPTTVKWNEVKAKLMNLAVANDRLKKHPITHVEVDESGSSRNGYIVVKAPEFVADFLVAYNGTAGEYSVSLKKTIPTLEALSGPEEDAIIAKYATWCDAAKEPTGKRPRA